MILPDTLKAIGLVPCTDTGDTHTFEDGEPVVHDHVLLAVGENEPIVLTRQRALWLSLSLLDMLRTHGRLTAEGF